jgi:copper chaperone
MKIESIYVANLKCSGCAQSITQKLEQLNGIQNIAVSIDEGHIEIHHDGSVNRQKIIATLLSIGYPEATAENGLLTKAKSYASCMVGKLSKPAIV